MSTEVFDLTVEGIEPMNKIMDSLDIAYLHNQMKLRREMKSKNGLLIAAFMNDEIRDIRNYIKEKFNNNL